MFYMYGDFIEINMQKKFYSKQAAYLTWKLMPILLKVISNFPPFKAWDLMYFNFVIENM